MIINKFEKYYFKNSNVEGIKTQINFSQKNNLTIVLHEETQNKYDQINDLEIVKAFPPLIFSVSLTRDYIKSLDTPVKIEEMTLLDGHHRFEHLTLYNYDYSVPVVLVSEQDVQIKSYNSILNFEKEKFIQFLFENNFKLTSSSKYFISVHGNQYSSEDINNIYDLYDFKRTLINLNLITSSPNNNLHSDEVVVEFTEIKLSELYKENYLFPPKSTWIHPRI